MMMMMMMISGNSRNIAATNRVLLFTVAGKITRPKFDLNKI